MLYTVSSVPTSCISFKLYQTNVYIQTELLKKNQKGILQVRNLKEFLDQSNFGTLSRGSICLIIKNKWHKVFKNGPSKNCGKQPLKKLKERLSSTNFTWPFLNSLSQMILVIGHYLSALPEASRPA